MTESASGNVPHLLGGLERHECLPLGRVLEVSHGLLEPCNRVLGPLSGEEAKPSGPIRRRLEEDHGRFGGARVWERLTGQGEVEDRMPIRLTAKPPRLRQPTRPHSSWP